VDTSLDACIYVYMERARTYACVGTGLHVDLVSGILNTTCRFVGMKLSMLRILWDAGAGVIPRVLVFYCILTTYLPE
jgi:hypothetical protein